MSDDLLSRPALGLLRVAAVSPELRVADVDFNVRATVAAVSAAAARHAVVVVCPELGLTGYSAGDLFRMETLLEAATRGLQHLAADLVGMRDVVAIVGLPLRVADGRVYNVAAVVSAGAVLGIVPKQYLPNRHEFYEDRWFTRALGVELPAHHGDVPFGVDLVFPLAGHPGATLGVEICEDLWAVAPPSGALALAGATLLANPSGSPELLGKAAYRRELVRQQSARCFAAYVYAGSGPGESTTDVVFAGHSLIAENGTILAETDRFRFDTQMAVCDIDVARLVHDRIDNSSFAAAPAPAVRRIEVPLVPLVPAAEPDDLLRPVARLPFVPSEAAARAAHCEEIFAIQATGLAKRLRHTGSQAITIGISGGLDSTLAVLVAVRAFDLLELPRAGIVAITMPGFGTTDRTYRNAVGLMAALGVTAREIPIAPAVRAHFADIGHDESVHDITYENAQARERTQILMDVANSIGGFVVGTGDLSEAALGWMTFNGDHMSMYHVNAGVPKTLVKYLVDWAAEAVFDGEATRILHDVVATPITPELLPLHDGRLAQETEATVGPYELHDFFLYQVVRNGSRPAKVFALARVAFSGPDGYDDATILRWLEVFFRRFFAQQFKRSSMPDGPKVGSVALSPRGDWRMPSDASAALWLDEVHTLVTRQAAT